MVGKVDVDPEAGNNDQLPNVEDLRVEHAAGGAPIRSRPRRKTTLIVVAAVVSILALGLAIGLPLRNDEDSRTMPFSGDPIPRGSRMAEVVHFLVEAGISNESTLRTANSPQWRGAMFMADLDRLPRAIPQSSDNENAFMFIQRYALSVLFYSLSGPFWRSSLRFLTPGWECYDWFQTVHFSDGSRTNYGVFCDKSGEVVAVKVPRWGAAGQIPPEIGALSKLQYLNLRSNVQIDGALPLSMSELTDLDYLALHYNDLSGPLPDWIGNLTKLEVLALSNNAFTGTIPLSWTQLSNMQTLALDDNLLWGDIYPLENLTEMTYLYLEDNEFQHDLGNDIDLSGMRKLVHIDLSDNLFFGSIPAYLFALDTLEVVDLSSNQFIGHLPDAFSDQSAMEHLFLYNNTIDGQIPDSIANPPNLTHLDLSMNNFVGDMPENIGNATKLTYLFLAQNDFTPGPIPPFVLGLTALSDLSLKATQRTGPIPDDIGDLDELILLDLDRNALDGKLPTRLGDMSRLELLLLNRNQFTGLIPTEMAKLSRLELVLLDNNTFTGSTAELCPRWEPRIQHFIADCGGDSPELDCECCTLCCTDDGMACNDEDLLAEFNPIWEAGYQRRDYVFSDNITIED